ncbi:hypothetical protein DYB26_008296 [Aphanomyces astaci]|uniref:Uncharacterized protein n=1 Tax=Aphanomyces astaci TaxID=112090 RepID=A0A3R7BS57_APHAT|nr:hypothetical protein DYB26_008296 [Aphanomyces astaci]
MAMSLLNSTSIRLTSRSDLERSILSILNDDVQVDKLKHPELYSVDADLLSATLKTETAKALSRLRALALTFLNSSMVDSLRKLFSNISCPFTLFESIVSRFENNPLTSDPAVLNAQSQKIKYHDGDCLDTLLADVKSIASQYRAAMIPSSLEIAASDYDAFLWANHYMVKLSEVFLDDKQIWDPIRAISSYAKASGQPCSVASIDTAIKDALATRHLRSLALGEHGTADSAHTRSHLINATVVEPASSSVGLVTSRSLPSYAHHKCHNHPGPACFYCGDSAHVLTNCKPLASDYAHGTKRGGFPQDVFDKHGKKNARCLTGMTMGTVADMLVPHVDVILRPSEPLLEVEAVVVEAKIALVIGVTAATVAAAIKLLQPSMTVAQPVMM